MATIGNPILTEIDRKHAELSPSAQQAIALSGVPAKAQGLGEPAATPAPQALVGGSAPPAGAPAEKIAPIAPRSNVRGLGPAPSQDPAIPPLIAERNRLNAPPLQGPLAHTKADTGQSGIGQIHNPIARGLLRGLDTLGTAFLPAVTMGIPGTELHHRLLVRQNANSINEAEKQAQTKAQTQAEEAQTQKALEATLTPHTIETDQGIMQFNPETGRFDIPVGQPPGKEQQNVHVLPDGSVVAIHHDPRSGKSTAEVVYKGDPSIKTQVVDQAIGGKQHNVLVNTQTGEVIKDLGEKGVAEGKKTPEELAIDEYIANHKGASIQEAREKTKIVAPERPPHALMIGPDNRAVDVRPGMTVPQGSMTPAGVNSTSVPTSQTRSMAEVAPKVIGFVDRIGQLIDQQEKNLGPGSSRMREFMAGKVGAGDPSYTQLRTDIGLLQTALMRMHVGARGGEQMMEHFRNLIDASKQDPANLRAALGEIRAYAESMQHHEGGASGGESGGHSGQVQVQIPGQAPGWIDASKKADFLKKYPNGKVL